MISVATDEVLQMLSNGWTVRHLKTLDVVEWRSPCGLSGSDFQSQSIETPPPAVLEYARNRGDIVPVYRVKP